MSRTVRELEEEIKMQEADYELLQEEYKQLLIDLAGKDEIIKELKKDIEYYKKDYRDQMIQDQGLDVEDQL